MRKIIPKHVEERKKRRSQFIVGGVLMFIMISSMLGYAFQSQLFDSNSATNATVTYNGMVFTSQNGFWTTGYRNEQLAFAYNPLQIAESDLTNLTKSIDDFSNKSLYIFSGDFNAESEIRFNLLPFASEIKNACPAGIECNGAEIRNCEDNFIIIQPGDESAREEKNCIFIYGEGDNLIKLADNILFKIFGIK
ncbi:MAG: hypothetical protein PHH00_00810 [Candidatus Nanoarchaeia archaeon]|nr:hypothetical protein [Candidatus Nanoarchaeia archaeon]